METEEEIRALDLRRTRSMGALPSETSSATRGRLRIRSDFVPPSNVEERPEAADARPNHEHLDPTTTSSLTADVRPPGVLGKIMVFLGYAGPNRKTRRALVSLIINLFWWFSQFAVIIAFIAYSAVHRSPTTPSLTEWAACDRALGPWNAIWMVRAVLGGVLAFWNWQRGRAADRTRTHGQVNDTEASTRLNGQANLPPSPRAALPRQPARPRPSYETTNGLNNTNAQNSPPSRLHSAVSLLTSLLTLAWFLSAHVLEYTSVHTCRFAAPHLWWLTFSILCTLYLEILEVLGLGLLVIVIGPVIYLLYNILLLCMGRHQLQNPHYFKPDIGKLPKSLVDQIPLVLYIPPPPGESSDSSPIPVPASAHAYPPNSPTSPASSSSTAASALPKRRFAWFRRKPAAKATKAQRAATKRSVGNADVEKNAAGAEAEEDEEWDADVPWDEMWEKGEYPFVRLEGNRAVCAICLMDFEEPKRVRGPKAKAKAQEQEQEQAAGAPTPPAASGSGSAPMSPVAAGDAKEDEGKKENATTADSGVQDQVTQEIRVEAVTEEERDALQLSDVGEGAQPLRLLSCGHVFHQICVDPWLTNVSGRCPICQRPVEIPQPSKKSKRRQRT